MVALSPADIEVAMVRRQNSGRGFLLDLEHRVESAVLEDFRAGADGS